MSCKSVAWSFVWVLAACKSKASGPGPGDDRPLLGVDLDGFASVRNVATAFVPRIVPDGGSSNIGDYRQRSVPIWFGAVDAKNNYVEARLGYDDSVLMMRVAVFDRKIYGSQSEAQFEKSDALRILIDLDGHDKATIDDKSLRIDASMGWHTPTTTSVLSGAGGVWTRTDTVANEKREPRIDVIAAPRAYRGTSQNEVRGWHVEFLLGWKALGLSGPPKNAAAFRLGIEAYDSDSNDGSESGAPQRWPGKNMNLMTPSTWGRVIFSERGMATWDQSGSRPGQGMPAYYVGLNSGLSISADASVPSTMGNEIAIREGLNGQTTEAASVGAAKTLCSGDDAYNFGTGASSWGNETERKYFHVQNQDDYADWPCFSKIYLKFPLSSIPKDQRVVAATLRMYHGTPTSGGDQGARSLIQAFYVSNTVSDGAPWTAANITWNNAPVPMANLAGTWGDRSGQELGWDKLPVWSWDVTPAVLTALTANDTHISFALNSADTDYHTGKGFTHPTDFKDWGRQDQRPTLVVRTAAIE